MSDLNPAPSAPAATPAESAPATEPVTPAAGGSEGASPADPAKAAAAEEASKPKPPSRLQSRINELTQQRYDEQRRADALEAQLAQHKRQQEFNQGIAKLDASEPQIDRYQSLAEYQRAMADWTTQRAVAHANAQWEQMMEQRAANDARFRAQAIQQQVAAQQEMAEIERKLGGGVKKYPDFVQVVTNPELPNVRGTALGSILMEADHADDISYSLAKNPGELERLLSLHPVQAAKEIYRLDQKFAGAPPTSAPPPPPQRSGTSHGSRDWSEMGTSEHAKAYWGRKR